MENIHYDFKIDACGTFCPEPIIRTAKLIQTIENGKIVLVVADDMAFAQDIQFWCKSTKNQLIDLKKITLSQNVTQFQAYILACKRSSL